MSATTSRVSPKGDTRRLLYFLKRDRVKSRIYGMPAEMAKEEGHRALDRVLAAGGMPKSLSTELRWFVGDVAAALAAGQGESLAFDLEGILAKWEHLGLEPNTMHLLLRIVCQDVGGIELPQPVERAQHRVRPARPAPKPKEADDGQA